MRSYRKLLLLFILLVITAAVGFVVYQRIALPPRAVLLLPEGNFVVYVNFAPTHFFDFKVPVESDPQYEDFVDRTGFHFEHDLDTVAVSQRNPGDPTTSDSAAVFTGHFDQSRLGNYFQKLAPGTETYADKVIYSLPNQGHVVRACILDASTVAVTNTESAETMHSIIDKSREFHLTSSGPFLVANYYRHVPFASLAWAMFRAPSVPGTPLLEEINADFLKDTVSVFSVRYTGSVRVRLEIFSGNNAEAKRVTEAASTLLVLGRGMTQSLNPGGTDKDVKAAVDSIQVEQNGNRTVVTVVIPQEFVKKLMSGINH